MADSNNGKINIVARIDTEKLRSDASESQGILHSIGRTAQQEGDNIDAAFRKVGMTIAGVFTAQKALEFGRSIIDVRKEIEGFEISFRTLLGNKEKADALFSQIRDFAVKTPLQLKDLSSAAQTLLSFNIEEAEIMPMLRAIGDISMGDTQKLQSLTLAFAQMSSTGKLMGQDLLQMINAGFNPLSVISEKTGKSIGVLKDEMSKGAISAEMVKQAFIDATAEGGKFHGMFEQQSQGIAGSISNLQGAVDDMMNDLGTAMQDTLVKGVNFATTLVKHYETIGKCLLGLVVAYGSYKAALLALVAVEKLVAFAENIRLIMMFRKELGLLTAAQQAFNITALKNPYIIAGAALIGIITTIYQLTKGTNEWEKANEELNEKLAEQEQTLKDLDKERNVTQDMHEEAAKSIAGEIEKVESLQAAIEDETASIADRRRAIKQLQAIVPGYQASLTDEGVLYVNNTNAVNDYIASLENLALAKALQSKRESLQAQKLAAELERREAVRKKKKAEAAAVQARKKAEQQRKASEEQQRQDQKFTNMVGGREGHMMAVADNVAARNRRNAIQEELDVAENTLKQRQQAVEIQDKIIANAVADLKELEDYQRENNIKPVQSQHTSYGGSGSGKGGSGGGGNSAATEAERLRREAQERKKALDEYQATLAEQDKEAEFDLRQQRINLAEDSTQKELDQIKLNYDRMLHENEKRRQEMYDALAEKKIVEYMDAHPKAEQSEVNEYAAKLTFTDADLTEEQRKQLEGYAAFAEEYLTESNKRTLANMLSDVLTYEEQRQKITEEYAKKREALYDHDDNGNRTGLKSGVSEGNVAELDRQEEDALSAIDEQFASREVEYQAWCEAIADLSLEQLQSLLEKAKTELDALKKQGGDAANLATARAKVNKLDAAVKTANAKDKLAPKKRTIKEWQDLYSTLNECAGAFDDIGEAVGGTAGEIIKVAGQISTSTLSMINGIVTLANSSGQAMAGTATAASTAIQTVEKASVILAVISAALQIATTIANLFNDDEAKQEEIERLQERIDQLQWELDNADIMRLNSQYGSSVERVRKAMVETRIEMINLARATGSWYDLMIACYGKLSSNTTALKKTVKALADQYEKMSYTADKALGDARYEDYYSQLENISEQQLLIQEQIQNEKDKKDTDWGQIGEWERKIEELGQQAAAVISDMLEDIIGGSAVQISEQLSDAFFDAFANGEDAAVAWGDKVKEIASDIVKRMLVQKMLEPEIGKIFDKYKAQWFKNGKFVGADEVKNSMGSFMADLMATQNVMTQIWDAIPEELKQYLTGDAEREGVEKGIATASQDSVDELNARATTIQSHTYSISENTKLLVANTNAILSSVTAIEAHTEAMSSRMESVERNVRTINSTLEDFNTQGMKLKK